MKTVQYEEMLPHELQSAIKKFSVAYVPVGSLEWHGKHLPYGTDSLIAYGILKRVAQKYGGVVVPPTYWGHMKNWKSGCHPGLAPKLVDQLFTEIFEGLVAVGFKVIIGVTGHGVKEQVASLVKAAEFITKTGHAKAFAMLEVALNEGNPAVGIDHAALWETAFIMALAPKLVQMKRIAKVKLDTDDDMAKAGIWGEDPRIHASKNVGMKAINLMVDAIGKKAKKLLASIDP